MALPAWAELPIRSAALEQRDGGTRLILESTEEFHFTLFILRYPNRLVLEIEDVTRTGVLHALAGQIPASHPHLRLIRVRPAPGKPRAVHVELELKGEMVAAVRTFKPSGGRDHRLVLDLAAAESQPAGAAISPIPAPAPPPASPPLRPSPPRPAAAPVPPSAVAEDTLLLEVTLDDHVLADAITAYQEGRRVFLPLGELAGLLTLAIRTQPAQGTAEGFVLSEARSFRLNVPQRRLALGEEAQAIDPALVRVRGDDIYVESGLLARWLPVDLHLDMSRLRLRVRPRETLPLQSRLQRERAGARVGTRSGGWQDPGFPRLETPYGLAGTPFLDQTLGLGLRTGKGRTEYSASYTTYLTGDLLGLESSLFVSRTRERPSTEVRYALGRHDPDAGLLGPLQARSVFFGSGVGLPSVPHVALSTRVGEGRGLTLSNRPLNQPANFDRHTLEGDLPPGWDVELYYNDALVGFQRARPDGRYRFEDLLLSYGANEFRLVFHGPLGQQRVERRSFLLDQTSTPAGAVHYHLTQHRDDAGALRSVGQVDWGLSSNLTGSAGWVRLPDAIGSAATGSSVYGKLGLRGFWGDVIAGTDLLRGPAGGWLSDTAIKTRVGSVAVDYNHVQLQDFVSEVFPSAPDPLRTRDRLRLQSALPAPGNWPRLPVTLEVQRDRQASGSSSLLLGGRVSAYVRNTSLTHQLAWQESGSGTSSFLGALSLSHRLGDVGVAGQLGYTLRPAARLDTIAVSGDRRFGEGYLASVGVARAMASGETLYSASLNKIRGEYGHGLSATYSKAAGLTVGLQLFFAMGREPREGRWISDALPKADTGAASLRVFLDGNGNGVLDAGEELIANAGLIVNGSRQPARTNEAGVAWLDRLPTRVPLDIALDVQTLEDPFWQPLHKGVRIVARPGHVATIDLPVVQISEIEGTVYLQEGRARRGIGNVAIELVDAAGSVVSGVRSSSDGYYVLAGVLQGRYTLRLSPQQLRQLGLADPGGRPVTVGAQGKLLSGADFVLKGAPKR
ncbi:AMIN domain-containing protein [Ramlibacter tataouinensis]|uniref:AMIN domain-containing protein n=1 Tax=Ramlibacter tataouinensis TaxID=94132 RepID=UPI001D0542CC|nr:AMIN domain-containing protein [Ramlibacter tataouinensis]